MIRVVFSTLLVFILSACSGAETAATHSIAGDSVPLLSYQVNSHSIAFEALSNGCSQADHFTLHIESSSSKAATVSVLRVKQDMCRRMPMWQSFSLALPPELQGKRVTVLNPSGSRDVKN